MSVWECLTGRAVTPTITQLGLIPLGLGAIILELNYYPFNTLFPIFKKKTCIYLSSPSASRLPCCIPLPVRVGWMEWTDVTVSHVGAVRHSHFHSAHHKHPTAFICMGVMAVGSGRMTWTWGRIPLFALDVHPPSAACVRVCVCARASVLVWLCQKDLFVHVVKQSREVKPV